MSLPAVPEGDAAELDKRFAVGNIVEYGTYPQTEAGDSAPIEWIVLARDGEKALLISRYSLDAQAYHTEWGRVTWENSYLRSWLNEDFLNKAFTAEEQAAILLTDVDNGPDQGNASWHGNGGNNTQDRVFLLSYAEAKQYFAANGDRRCAPTDYAIALGAHANRKRTVDGRPAGNWWLRSPGEGSGSVVSVQTDGSLNYGNVDRSDGGVRPALWVDLTSGAF